MSSARPHAPCPMPAYPHARLLSVTSTCFRYRCPRSAVILRDRAETAPPMNGRAGGAERKRIHTTGRTAFNTGETSAGNHGHNRTKNNETYCLSPKRQYIYRVCALVCANGVLTDKIPLPLHKSPRIFPLHYSLIALYLHFADFWQHYPEFHFCTNYHPCHNRQLRGLPSRTAIKYPIETIN